LQKLAIVFKWLEHANFCANLHKCFFAQEELEYLGYWLTRRGLQPQPKKVEAISRLTPPKMKHQLQHFLGMVNFHCNMWRMRSHKLAPLSALVQPKYGKLPETHAEDAKPWKRVDLDMIGPYDVPAVNGKFTLRALTMIDPATRWFEVKDVPDYTTNSTQAAFDEVMA
jgi:hypothetical protein